MSYIYIYIYIIKNVYYIYIYIYIYNPRKKFNGSSIQFEYSVSTAFDV